MIGLRPDLSISTLAGLTSTPITWCPMLAKHAAVTEPVYPRPKTLIDELTLFAFYASLAHTQLLECGLRDSFLTIILWGLISQFLATVAANPVRTNGSSSPPVRIANRLTRIIC